MEKEITDLGKYLKELKDAAGFSLGKLASELQRVGGSSRGASRQYLSQLINGQVKAPSPEVLENLAKALKALATEFSSDDYWRSTGKMPDDASAIASRNPAAYSALIKAAERIGFSKMLEEQGLNDEVVANILSRVDENTIRRVYEGDEPLVVRLSGAPEEEIQEHLEKNYQVLALCAPGTAKKGGASSYLADNKDIFSGAPASKRASKRKSRKGKRTEDIRYIKAGRARIHVRGEITDKQESTLAAIATVIKRVLEE